MQQQNFTLFLPLLTRLVPCKQEVVGGRGPAVAARGHPDTAERPGRLVLGGEPARGLGYCPPQQQEQAVGGGQHPLLTSQYTLTVETDTSL